MILHKKRIRNILPHIHNIPVGSSIVFGISNINRFSAVLKQIGFLEPYENGQTTLPTAIGTITYFNAEGKQIVHKDQPKETVYHSRLHHWTEWHGPHRVQRSGIVDFKYERYPRSLIEPPSIELTISTDKNGQFLLTAPSIKNSPENKLLMAHIVNVFLEIFGECQLFTDALDNIITTPIKRLNWNIFPIGKVPWEQLKKAVEPIIKNKPKDIQPVLYYRLETVNKHKPDLIAIGTAGFHGYIVHGFTKENLFILESVYYGNATYVFDNTWEELSKMTKAEILRASLQKIRIIHGEGWSKKLEEIMKETR